MKKIFQFTNWLCMSHRLLLMIVIFNLQPSFFSIHAQTIGEAFYIYRNDGGFNAFFREEVDSIVYSHFDTDSIFYNEIVTQLVYTADSIYRIPLSSIDSVGFVTPSPKINSSVFPLTAEHSQYVIDADSIQFSMSANTPTNLLPNIGNIVVATADCSAFSDGIVAKVESRQKFGTHYKYNCSLASLDDVFDELLIHSTQYEPTYMHEDSRSFPLRRASVSHELWNNNWTKTISGGGTTTTINVGDRSTIVVTARKTLNTPLFFQLELLNTISSNIYFNAKSSMGIWQEVQIGNTISAGKITIPYTLGLLWLVPKLTLYGYFEEEGKVELNYSGHFNRTDKVVFTYSNGKWTFNYTPNTSAGTDIAQLSMDGHAEVGLRPQIDFSLNGRKSGFGMSAKVGLKEYINFVFDITKLSDGSLYDAMRDSYCRTTIPWTMTAHANADIFKKYDSNFTDVGFATATYTFTPSTEPQWGEDRFIFPLFSNVEGKRNGNKAVAEASISRNTLLPVKVGFSLIDQDKNIVNTAYDERLYLKENSFSNYRCEISGVESNGKYTIRPSIKLLGYDVIASPEEDLKVEHSCPDSNHPHWIDMGLPSGTKWRCCNDGASTPEAYGGYYTFGQSSSAPSSSQIYELINNCTYKWTSQNGIVGGEFTGPNGGKIFLPAAGYCWDGDFRADGYGGYFWSSTLFNSSDYSYELRVFSDHADCIGYDQRSRVSVRSVR